MTIFVGPNNSGKSLVLREIEDLFGSKSSPSPLLLGRLSVRLPEPAIMEKLLLSKEVPSEHGQTPHGYLNIAIGKPGGGTTTNRVHFDGFTHQYRAFRVAEIVELSHTHAPRNETISTGLGFLVLLLDGRTRLGLTDPIAPGDLLGAPINHLSALLHDDQSRSRMREITKNALGVYFTIDPTGMSRLRVRMSDRAPVDPDEELGLTSRARAFHQDAQLIQDMSDGVKAFTGINAAILSGDYRVYLLDEPEAFLHPPLAHELGQLVTSLAAEKEAHVFASTHSAHFLIGCIEAGKPVDVVRLTYERGIPQARLLPAADVQALMQDPLMRSTDVLGALFHRGAIICEADRDRAFYAEINRRLLENLEEGAKDSIFLNAQNAQTVRRILSPLRNMGIPAAAIVDLDILKDNTAFKELCKAACVPGPMIQSWGVLRGNLEALFRTSGDSLKTGGVSKLSSHEKQAAESLLLGLRSYGVFIVPVGEVEDWLALLGVPKTGKSQWLTKIFDAMRSDPADPEYLKPGKDDVWSFIQAVAEWINNPLRHGMPD
jgi:hypothetical protein